jgi:hypothetical protein
MKKKEMTLSNAKIAIVFFVFLSFIVGISLILKFTIILKNGKFDSSRSFIFSVTNGKNIEVISLSPNLKSITTFKFKDNVSSTEAGRLLEIPIDGTVASGSLDLNQKIKSLSLEAIVNCNKLKTNLTILDFLRIALFVRSIPESAINTKVVGTGGLGQDKILDNLINDPLIEKDHQTIQVVNGTSISGLGNRLAKLITNIGGNVILVMTDNNQKKKSVITYIDKKTYTIERLQKILGYEVVKDLDNAMSDVTIIIGEDKVGSNPF